MRHGDAVLGADDDAACAFDLPRPEQSRAMALVAANSCRIPDRVLVSPYLRAQQTWQTIGDLFR